MKISLNDFLAKVSTTKPGGEVLYNLNDFCTRLEEVDIINIFFDEDECYVFELFYLDDGTYNLYWIYIALKSVELPSLDDFILSYVGKQKMSMVCEQTKERLESLYLEVIKPDTTIAASKLLKCANFMRTSQEIIQEVVDVFQKRNTNFKFNTNCLFLSFY